MATIPAHVTEQNRYVFDNAGRLVPTGVDLSTPWRGPWYYRPHVARQEASPTGKHGGRIFRLLTPPLPIVRMLTNTQTRPAQPPERRQGGRLAANGYVDPYLVRQGPAVSGLVSPDFRFVP